MSIGTYLSTFALLALVACGDNSPMSPDAASDAADAPNGTPITVKTTKLAPALVAYRETAASTWRTPTMNEPNVVTFWVNGPYVVTVVCQENANYVWIEQHARTLDDSHELVIWCDSPGNGPHHVTGATVQSAWVWTASAGIPSEPGQGFDLRLLPGTYDLIATIPQATLRAERIAFRRGIMVAGDVSITNPIDIVTEGAVLAPLTVTAPNVMPSEVVRVRGRIETLNDSGAPLFIGTTLDNALFVPNSALLSTDVQLLTVSASSNGFARRLERRFREGDSTEFVLPDAIGPVTFSRTGDDAVATWSTLPAHDVIRSEIRSTSEEPPFVTHSIAITRAYEIAVAPTVAATDTAIPGFRPEWRVDLDKPYVHSLSVERRAGNDLLTSSQEIMANGPPPVP